MGKMCTRAFSSWKFFVVIIIIETPPCAVVATCWHSGRSWGQSDHWSECGATWWWQTVRLCKILTIVSSRRCAGSFRMLYALRFKQSIRLEIGSTYALTGSYLELGNVCFSSLWNNCDKYRVCVWKYTKNTSNIPRLCGMNVCWHVCVSVFVLYEARTLMDLK